MEKQLDLNIHVTRFFSILYCKRGDIAHYSKAGKRPVNIIFCIINVIEHKRLQLILSQAYSLYQPV